MHTLRTRLNTFEGGLLVLLLVLWLANCVTEKTTLGRVLMGRKSELYPMSTFSVYLSEKQSATSVLRFVAYFPHGAKPVTLEAYDMFYPLAAPDLDDEIATNQLYGIVKAYDEGCATNLTANFKHCEKRLPGTAFHLQPDVARMFLRSIRHHGHTQAVPQKVEMQKTVQTFNPRRLSDKTTVSRKTFFTFYPQQGWRADED